MDSSDLLRHAELAFMGLFLTVGRALSAGSKTDRYMLGVSSVLKWLRGASVLQSLRPSPFPGTWGGSCGEKRTGQMLLSLSRIWPLGMQGFHACSGPSFILQQDIEKNTFFLSLWPIYEPASTNVPVFLGEVAANFFFTC